MDLKQLEYFVRVAELGSFTRASNALEIAQPALSRQIRQLETELRQNLLIRNGRGVVMTDAGKLLLGHARGILHQVVRTREDLDRVRGATAGRVAIGMPPSISKVLTLPLTTAFRQKLPQAALSISEGLSLTTQDWLMSGRLDIALLYNPSYSPEVETTELFEEELYLIGHENTSHEKITLEDIAELPLIIPARPNALRMLIETKLSEIGKKIKIAFEVDGISAILDLVHEKLGFAILPKYAVQAGLQHKQFSICAVPTLRSRLVIATAANRPVTLTQHAVMDLIRDVSDHYIRSENV